MYEKGDGVEESYEKAVEWYLKAAEQGLADARNVLGLMYKNGLGVEQSYEKAVEWYLKAAEQGNADAQCNLGWMYAVNPGPQSSPDYAIIHTYCSATGWGGLGIIQVFSSFPQVRPAGREK